MKRQLCKKALAECTGTFAIVFLGCGSVALIDTVPGSVNPQAVPLIFGMTVSSMIYALGHVSGAHFNPVVTLAFALFGRFPKNEVLHYWLGQLLGALFAVLLLKILIPSAVQFGGTAPTVTLFQALGWEIALTFFLVFVIFAVATDSRAEGVVAGLAIGSIVALGSFVGGAITGASMNPFRSLAPAVFERNFSCLWIYFLGPAIGALLAGFLYEQIRCGDEAKEAKGCC